MPDGRPMYPRRQSIKTSADRNGYFGHEDVRLVANGDKRRVDNQCDICRFWSQNRLRLLPRLSFSLLLLLDLRRVLAVAESTDHVSYQARGSSPLMHQGMCLIII